MEKKFEKDGDHNDFIINTLLHAQYAIYRVLSEEGVMTEELKSAYEEFIQTASDVFETERGDFLIDKVLVKIPNNVWIPVFFAHAKALYE